MAVFIVLHLSGAARAGSPDEDAACQKCHAKAELARLDSTGHAHSLFVDPTKYSASEHANIGCVACHIELANVSELPHRIGLKPVDCSGCHMAEAQQFAVSTHWRIASGRPTDAMSCGTCHGTHYILSSADSRASTHRKNIAALCLKCHEEKTDSLTAVAPAKYYRNSVHGRKVLAQGDSLAAECADCHGSHKILPTDDPDATVNKPHIPQTCGRCHAAVLEEYGTSIHGRTLARGILDSPVCTDCHGEHTIEQPDLAASSVSSARIPETCGQCHENVQLTEKYGIPAKRYSTYEDSYHGLANQYGKTIVANCASCHGYHHILPISDPASTIHPVNLANTCGKCHPNAGENFAKGKMHVQATMENSPGVFFVRRFYYVFIGALMVLFIAYIIIEYSGFAKRRRAGKK
jgi:hypothetical protein